MLKKKTAVRPIYVEDNGVFQVWMGLMGCLVARWQLALSQLPAYKLRGDFWASFGVKNIDLYSGFYYDSTTSVKYDGLIPNEIQIIEVKCCFSLVNQY